MAFSISGPWNLAWICGLYRSAQRECKIYLIWERKHTNEFNCTTLTATLTCQPGKHLTLFAPLCVFLLIQRWLHQTHGFWKSYMLLRNSSVVTDAEGGVDECSQMINLCYHFQEYWWKELSFEWFIFHNTTQGGITKWSKCRGNLKRLVTLFAFISFSHSNIELHVVTYRMFIFDKMPHHQVNCHITNGKMNIRTGFPHFICWGSISVSAWKTGTYVNE